MDTKKTIRKIILVTIWVAVGAGMLTLLIAAIGRQRKDTCKDYTITIKGKENEDVFLNKAEIVKLLKAVTKGNIKGQSKASFDLKKMEQLLEENVWVKDAQVYIDNKDVLHVSVEERKPVARVFTAGGRSFYIDESEKVMELSDKQAAKLPVFTGFPDKKKLAKNDSLLLHDINTTAQFISKNSFWSSQVSQLDINSCGPDCWEFDMIPLIGNHIVKLGDAENIDKKFDRLFIFYKNVLSKSGFDKYKTIDVRYEGQVVGAKSENPKVDAAQLRKNVETLLRQIKEAEKNSDAGIIEATPVVKKAAPADETAVNDKPADKTNKEDKPKPVKSNPTSPEKKKTATVVKDPKPKTDNKAPKAVMKKKG